MYFIIIFCYSHSSYISFVIVIIFNVGLGHAQQVILEFHSHKLMFAFVDLIGKGKLVSFILHLIIFYKSQKKHPQIYFKIMIFLQITKLVKQDSKLKTETKK